MKLYFLYVEQQPNSSLDRLALRFLYHTHAHTTHGKAHRRGNAVYKTQNKQRDDRPCPQRDSNPRSQPFKWLQTYAVDGTAPGINNENSVFGT